jgi:hypothetical protein
MSFQKNLLTSFFRLLFFFQLVFLGQNSWAQSLKNIPKNSRFYPQLEKYFVKAEDKECLEKYLVDRSESDKIDGTHFQKKVKSNPLKYDHLHFLCQKEAPKFSLTKNTENWHQVGLRNGTYASGLGWLFCASLDYDERYGLFDIVKDSVMSAAAGGILVGTTMGLMGTLVDLNKFILYSKIGKVPTRLNIEHSISVLKRLGLTTAMSGIVIYLMNKNTSLRDSNHNQ